MLLGMTALAYWGYKPLYEDFVKPQDAMAVQYQRLDPAIPSPLPSTVVDTINYYAEKFAVDPKLALAIIDCESKGDNSRIGDSNTPMVSYGLWQWQALSFYAAAKKYGVKNADIRDHRDQTLVAMQVLRDGGKDIWTCGRKLK
jgi:hypothetical protein